MRYAVLSDIHGNLDALKAVYAALSTQNIDVYTCLGDIVGYGPQPAECLQEIQKYNSITIAGNHDCAATSKININTFNLLAREAVLWTRGRLSEADLDFLGNLPLVERLDGFDLVHGTLYAPELFDYVQTSYDAYLSMSRMESPLCFIGHSHIPIIFVQDEVIGYTLAQELRIDPGKKAIVNVGSVGQPRDRDPRASFAVYDTTTQTVSIQRIPYDIDAVVAKVREAGLPPALGERLRVGR